MPEQGDPDRCGEFTEINQMPIESLKHPFKDKDFLLSSKRPLSSKLGILDTYD